MTLLKGDGPTRPARRLIRGRQRYMQVLLCRLRNLVRQRPRHGAAMTTFDKREEGFEKQFAHDEELRFRATARRNKQLGLWAASKLGLSGDEADAYVKAVVLADFEAAGDDDVFAKVRKDFDDKRLAVSDQEIRRTMTELLAKAVEEIKSAR
jgi:hypothetical protein